VHIHILGHTPVKQGRHRRLASLQLVRQDALETTSRAVRPRRQDFFQLPTSPTFLAAALVPSPAPGVLLSPGFVLRATCRPEWTNVKWSGVDPRAMTQASGCGWAEHLAKPILMHSLWKEAVWALRRGLRCRSSSPLRSRALSSLNRIPIFPGWTCRVLPPYVPIITAAALVVPMSHMIHAHMIHAESGSWGYQVPTLVFVLWAFPLGVKQVAAYDHDHLGNDTASADTRTGSGFRMHPDLHFSTQSAPRKRAAHRMQTGLRGTVWVATVRRTGRCLRSWRILFVLPNLKLCCGQGAQSKEHQDRME
jgi:hypothetical protein